MLVHQVGLFPRKHYMTFYTQGISGTALIKSVHDARDRALGQWIKLLTIWQMPTDPSDYVFVYSPLPGMVRVGEVISSIEGACDFRIDYGDSIPILFSTRVVL